MRKEIDLLLATTNPGKRQEIERYFADLPVTLHSLEKDYPDIESAPETTGTVEGNAIQKAKYYATHSGMLTLAEDTGLFIEALDGWPGVDAALIANTPEERNSLLLEKLSGKSGKDRSAYFQSTIVCYDPKQDHMLCSSGILSGTIGREPQYLLGKGFGYDPLFVVDKAGKTLAEMNPIEKNAISHRGRALSKLASWLDNDPVEHRGVK